ncbi:MAG: NAD-dependent epimerase/dehydratase family protein [Nanoarchaeota archaeon]
MEVLVTGAPGWLGTSLVEELVKKRFKVRCLVLEGLDSSYLEKLGAVVIKGNVLNRETLDKATKGVDIVFHCAGIIHPKKIKELYQVNYFGTKNLLDSAIDSGVKKFILVSSNSPMGCNEYREILFKEDDPYNPYKNYGKSKMLAEKYANYMFKEGKIDVTIIRPCWFYGPNQPLRQTTFFKMIKKGNPIVFGDGQNLRSMSYVDNIVQGLILAAESKKSSGQTYWIADSKPYSTLEIYGTIADLLNVKLKPRFVPGLMSTMCEISDGILQGTGLYIKEIHVAGEMNKNIACSIEKARKELGYNPKIDLREGMKRSIEWCRKQGVEI